MFKTQIESILSTTCNRITHLRKKEMQSLIQTLNKDNMK